MSGGSRHGWPSCVVPVTGAWSLLAECGEWDATSSRWVGEGPVERFYPREGIWHLQTAKWFAEGSRALAMGDRARVWPVAWEVE